MTSLSEINYSQPLGLHNPLDEVTVASVLLAMLETMPQCPFRSYLLSTPSASVLEEVAWVQEMSADSDQFEKVLDRKVLMAKGGIFPENHLLKSMTRRGMIRDTMAFFRKSPEPAVYNIYALSEDVCGHEGIVHGGFSSTIIDETFGYLTYMCRQSGLMDFGIVFTAHLEVDYKQPLKAGSTVLCVASLEKVEGRKIWVKAQLLDQPGGVVYATGKALFIIPRGAESKPATS